VLTEADGWIDRFLFSKHSISEKLTPLSEKDLSSHIQSSKSLSSA
jgi:hypothetical protein